MRMQGWLVGMVLGCAVVTDGAAATVRELEVEHRDEAYRVRFEAVVNLAPDRVFELLTDYDRLEQLNPGIVEAERLSHKKDPDAEWVRTVVKACVAFFCRSMKRVEAVQSHDQRVIVARLVPEQSDFRSGKSRWELAAVSGGTRIRFRSRMVPDFWVPGVIGPWAVKREMGNHLRGLVQRLEELAGESG